jgi:hypothetical protein
VHVRGLDARGGAIGERCARENDGGPGDSRKSWSPCGYDSINTSKINVPGQKRESSNKPAPIATISSAIAMMKSGTCSAVTSRVRTW